MKINSFSFGDDYFNEDDFFRLIVDDKSVIFIANDFSSPIKFVYNSFEEIGLFGITSIEDILSRIDTKSEIASVIGIQVYLDDIWKKLNSDESISKIYLPLKINEETKVYCMKISKIKANDNHKYMCYIKIDDDTILDLERLYSNSYKDSLTFLFNRNALMIHNKNPEDSHFYGFMDLDGFKEINDNFSHHIGNLLLTEIGKKLISISNDNVIFYRYGGDEFVFMTVNCSEKETLEYADKIRNAIQSIDFNGIKPSFSIGISEYKMDYGYTNFEALKIADLAMYKSKYSGKNKISYINKEEASKILKDGNIDEILNEYSKNRRKCYS